MNNTRCAVSACKINVHNKPPGVYLHPCPSSSEMRNKWLFTLSSKCSMLDWARSKICSRHFERKYFDSDRKLKDNAIPTIFPPTEIRYKTDVSPKPTVAPKSVIEKLLLKQTQTDLIIDVKNSLNKLKEPLNLHNFANEYLNCKSDAPQEAQLWLLIKKQDHLIKRLMEQVSQNKKHVEVLRKNLDDSRAAKKDMETSFETMKYIVKSLQEKHATLEEQIEILTAVESR